MKGLTATEVQELLSNTKRKGVYGLRLLEFFEGEELAINPRDVWPIDFATKKGTAMYQSFNNAAKNAGLEDKIEIKQTNNEVFLIHLERATLAINELNDDLDSTDENENEANEETSNEAEDTTEA